MTRWLSAILAALVVSAGASCGEDGPSDPASPSESTMSELVRGSSTAVPSGDDDD